LQQTVVSEPTKENKMSESPQPTLNIPAPVWQWAQRKWGHSAKTQLGNVLHQRMSEDLAYQRKAREARGNQS
jgi:hypothetical protein